MLGSLMGATLVTLFTLLNLPSEGSCISKRGLDKNKNIEKPKENTQYLNMTYKEISEKMTHFLPKDFAEVATGHRRIFVYFSSAKDYEGLRALRGFYGAFLRMGQRDLNITWGMVDCDANRQLCENQDIYFAPQYYLYINKRRVNYTAGRSAFLVSEWIHKTIAYPGEFIDKRSQLSKFKESQDRFFFYIGHMDEDWDYYREIAASYPYYLWVACFDRDRMMHANGIYWHEISERAEDMRNGPHGGKVMLNFTLKYFNHLRQMNAWVLERVFIHDRAAIILFFPDTNEERGIQMTFWSAVQELKWEILNLQLPMKDPLDNHHLGTFMDFVGMTNPKSTAMRIINLNKNGVWDIYQLRDRIHHDTALSFYRDFRAGKLTPMIRSDKPAEHRAGELRKLVGKNFAKYAHNPEYDAVVIFHKRNCTVSDRLLALSKVMLRVLARYEDIRIYEVDTWLNSAPGIPHTNLPQVHLLPRNDKLKPIIFNGLYTAKDLIGWICENLGRENPYEEEMNRLNERQSRREGSQQQDI